MMLWLPDPCSCHPSLHPTRAYQRRPCLAIPTHPPGPNTTAAIMRAGLNEMRRFAKALYPTVRCCCLSAATHCGGGLLWCGTVLHAGLPRVAQLQQTATKPASGPLPGCRDETFFESCGMADLFGVLLFWLGGRGDTRPGLATSAAAPGTKLALALTPCLRPAPCAFLPLPCSHLHGWAQPAGRQGVYAAAGGREGGDV